MKHKDNKNGIYNINKAYNKSVSKRGWDSKDIINTTAVKQGNVGKNKSRMARRCRQAIPRDEKRRIC